MITPCGKLSTAFWKIRENSSPLVLLTGYDFIEDVPMSAYVRNEFVEVALELSRNTAYGIFVAKY